MEETLKYPIGKFQWNALPTSQEIEIGIKTLEDFPQKLRTILSKLSEEDLLKQYRPEGWNIAQIVHHLADSHMHCYLRLKHAVLEETPHIKDYNEADWANLPDASSTTLEPSVALIEALHRKWCLFLRSLNEVQYVRAYFHPERNKNYHLGTTILVYAWHCEHHLEHIRIALKG